MNSFLKSWVNDVKPLASECVDKKYVDLINVVSKRRPLTQNENAYLNVIRDETKDLNGMFRINKAITLIDAAVIKHDYSEANMYAKELLDYLSRSNYCKEKFDGNKDNPEWKRIDSLRHELHRMTVIYTLMI